MNSLNSMTDFLLSVFLELQGKLSFFYSILREDSCCAKGKNIGTFLEASEALQSQESIPKALNRTAVLGFEADVAP